MQSCPSCGHDDLSISRYPGFISRFFAGLMLMHCPKCGLSWVPVPNLDLDDYYTNYYTNEFQSYRRFEGKFFSSANPVWSREKHPSRDRARNHSQILGRYGKMKRVLDIGCGEGILLHMLSADEKYAWEPDKHVQRILEEEVGAIRVSGIEDVQDLDAIVASHVLEHFTYENILEKIDQIYNSLRPGGIFLAEVPDGAAQIAKFTKGERPPEQRLEPHTLFYSSYSLCRLIKASGFEIKETKICEWTRNNVDKADLAAVIGPADTSQKPLIVVAQKPLGQPGGR
ncbi:MAG: class I SAM-dependent methyltransferase [Pseudomonadota bacterium]